MPKIPLDFKAGSTADSDHSIGNMPSTNLYPTVDRSTGKVMVKAPVVPETVVELTSGGYIAGVIEAFTSTTSLFTKQYMLISRDGGVYNMGMYIDGVQQASISLTPDFAPDITGSYSMATNGINIVCVKRGFDKATSDDFVYDIDAKTFTKLNTFANYTSFGTAEDVTYMNERYHFITKKNIFQGDPRTAGNDGLSFNAAAFGLLASPTYGGTAIEAVSGRIYAFTEAQGYMYDDVGTSPFSLQRNTGVDLDIGCIGAGAKVKNNNIIYMLSYDRTGRAGIFALSGTQYSQIADQQLLMELYGASNGINPESLITSFGNGENTFLQVNTKTDLSAETKFYLYDTALGASHIRGSDASGNYPSYYFASANQSTSPTILRSFGYINGNPCYSTVSIDNQNDCYLDDYDTGNYSFIYYLPYIRQDSAPFVLSSVRLSVANCDSVTIALSEDGEIFDTPSAISVTGKDNGSAIVERRRINRKLSQVMFKITLTQAASQLRPAIISGAIGI